MSYFIMKSLWEWLGKPIELKTLIGLRGLRGINFKSVVSPIESVIFDYEIIMEMTRGVECRLEQ